MREHGQTSGDTQFSRAGKFVRERERVRVVGKREKRRKWMKCNRDTRQDR